MERYVAMQSAPADPLESMHDKPPIGSLLIHSAASVWSRLAGVEWPSAPRAVVRRYPDGGFELTIHNQHPGEGSRRSHDQGEPMERVAASHWRECCAVRRVAALPIARVERDHMGEALYYVVPRSWCPALVSAAQIIRRHQSDRRAVAEIRRLARFNRFCYMSTLTLPAGEGNDRSRDGVYRVWRHFLKGEGARFFHPSQGGYLMVPEEHSKRPGEYHLHVLHRDRFRAVAVRHAWTRCVLSLGYILPDGMQSVRTHELYAGSSRRASNYVAKYVGKAVSADRGRRDRQRRYYPSAGLSDGALICELGSLAAVRAVLALIPADPTVRFHTSAPGDPLWFVYLAYDPPEPVRVKVS